jgi:uncharacterized protein (DUF1330 family)
MVAYVIAEIDVTDPERYKDYAEQVRPVLAKHGAKALARAGALEVFEGKPGGARIVVLEFPSLEAAKRWYHADDYAGPKAIRQEASTATLFAVEGL